MPGMTYQVRIHYREPTYELYAGRKKRPYHWTYSISAASPKEAKLLALREFAEMALISSVGWKRKIILVELEGGLANAS